MAPGELERAVERARAAYAAMTPAEHRRESRRARRADRMARLRAWWRRPAPEGIEDAAASFMTTQDTHI